MKILGAIVGDIAGSIYEWHNIKTKDFPLFSAGCRPTDDSIMSLAVAKALMESKPDHSDLAENTVRYMQEIGRLYPDCGYGGSFRRWLSSDNPAPYNSFGNGAAMRVSPVAHAANSLEDCENMAEIVTAVTHNHPEGIKGAKAAAGCVYLSLHGSDKAKIKTYAEGFYSLDFTIDEIRSEYSFDVTCQGSVPQAIEAFLEAYDFEDAIRNAISIGGDSDTIAAIAGGIAGAFYGVPDDIAETAFKYLDAKLKEIIFEFSEKFL